MDRDEKLKLDYEQTNQLIGTLTDVRFKLLAFVPVLTGAAVALVTRSQNQTTVLAVGLLGLFVTLGIVFYEMRNTVIYDSAMHRAKHLERCLGFPLHTKGMQKGGLFNERGPRPYLFYYPNRLRKHGKSPGFLQVWHDRALAIVYGSAIGGWVYIVAYALLTSLTEQPAKTNGFVAVLAALIVASLSIWTLHRFEERPDKSKPVGQQLPK
jgi:hypothetical protein